MEKPGFFASLSGLLPKIVSETRFLGLANFGYDRCIIAWVPISWYALMNRQRIILGSVFLVVVGLGIAWMPLPSTTIGKKAEEITVMIDGCVSASGVIYQREGNTYSVLTASHGLTDYPFTCLIFTPDGSRYEASQPKIPVEDLELAVLTFESAVSYTHLTLPTTSRV